MLVVKDLTVAFYGKTILDHISFEVKEGDWLMIIGQNGAGKTTVTNAVSQNVPFTGEIFYKDKDIKKMKPTERAKEIGVLMQRHNVAYSYTVEEVVALGRYSHSKGIFGKPSEAEEEMIEKALRQTGMLEKKEQSILTLSGGELQRTFLSQLITQDPSLMILDEPTNHLDMAYQEQVFNLIKEWLQNGNRAVISVVHDLRLARLYGNRVLILKEGQLFRYGEVEEIMNEETLSDAYDFNVYGWLNKLNEKWTS